MVAITTDCTFDKVYDSVGFCKYYTLIIRAPSTASSTNTIVFKKSIYGTVVGGVGFEVSSGKIEALSIALLTDDYTITVGTGSTKARGYVLTMLRPDNDE